MAPQIPLEGLDGKYSFTISQLKMGGRILISHEAAYMMEPRRCVPIEGPKSSDELRASWFECVAGIKPRPSSPSLRLRISAVDPMSQSRWYQRLRVLDTLEKCTQYLNGRCTNGYRYTQWKWGDRNGSITVERGWPVRPDTGVAPELRSRGQLRVRCDTTTKGLCQPNDDRERR
jgi:hypothetical protein